MKSKILYLCILLIFPFCKTEKYSYIDKNYDLSVELKARRNFSKSTLTVRNNSSQCYFVDKEFFTEIGTSQQGNHVLIFSSDFEYRDNNILFYSPRYVRPYAYTKFPIDYKLELYKDNQKAFDSVFVSIIFFKEDNPSCQKRYRKDSVGIDFIRISCYFQISKQGH